MIPAGQRIAFQVTGVVDGLWPPGDAQFQAAVTGDLHHSFVVESFVLATDGLWAYSYRADLTLQTREAYAKIEDVAGVVGHPFWERGGSAPIVAAPDFGLGIEQPKADPSTEGFGAWIAGLGKGLQQTTTVVAIAAALIAIVILREK